MAKKKKHTARFKSMVALDAAKELKTLNELASQYGVYPAQISEWKKQLLNGLEGIFTTQQKSNNGQQKKLDELHRIVGEITVERDWLKKKLHNYP
jgi:transposase-like protein